MLPPPVVVASRRLRKFLTTLSDLTLIRRIRLYLSVSPYGLCKFSETAPPLNLHHPRGVRWVTPGQARSFETCYHQRRASRRILSDERGGCRPI